MSSRTQPVWALLVGCMLFSSVLSAQAPNADFNRLPVTFEANRGQAPAGTLYVTNTPGRPVEFHLGNIRLQAPASQASSAVQISFADHHPDVTITAEDLLATRSNYFTGNDHSQWLTGIENYARLRYRALYPGIDLLFYGNQQGKLEFDYVIAPGADPRAIALDLDCKCRLQVSRHGDLLLSTGDKPIIFHRPVAYQQVAGKRSAVPAAFRVHRGNRVTFEVGDYDRRRELVIDPVFAFVSYFGGDPGGSFNALAVAPGGEVFLAMQNNGYTAQDPAAVWIAKLSASGTSLLYTTVLARGSAAGIKAGANGVVYVAGTTQSTSFPTTEGAYQSSAPPQTQDMEGQGRQFAFVTKLNASGGIEYSTYLAGGGLEIARAMDVDPGGNVYVMGWAYSADFPLSANAYQRVPTPGLHAPVDFVAKLNPTGSALLYSTLFGGGLNGAGFTSVEDIAVDVSGNALLAGSSSGDSFPTTEGAFQRSRGCCGAAPFLTKLNAEGSGLVYSTFIGGDGDASHVAADGNGSAIVLGRTYSTTFPTTAGAFQRSLALPLKNPAPFGSDVFVAKFSADGSSLTFSTYVGGSGDEFPIALALDGTGKPHVIAQSWSANFPQVPTEGYGAVGFRMNSTGTQLEYAWNLGSITNGQAAIGLDNVGNFYIGGTAPLGPGRFPTRDGEALLAAPFHGDGVFLLKVENTSGPSLSRLPETLNFGEVLINTDRSQVIMLKNAGDQPLEITGVAATGDFSQTNDCTTLAAGYSCAVTVKFHPTAIGVTAGTLVVTSNTNLNLQQAQLAGEGINPILGFSQASSSFGAQPVGKTSAPLPVVFTNTGTTPATLQLGASMYLDPWEYDPGDFSHTNLCAVIPAGGSCTEYLYFTPLALGVRRYYAHIYSNARMDSLPELSNFVGIGIVPVTLSPDTVEFGQKWAGSTSAPQSLLLKNDGGAPIQITAINLTGSFTQANDCPVSLAAGASCTFTVAFRPASSGSSSGLLAISDNALGGLRVASLHGTGTDFQFVLGRSSRSGRNASGVTVAAGQTVQVPIELLSDAGLNEVLFRCEGLSPGSRCSFAKAGDKGYVMTVHTAPSRPQRLRSVRDAIRVRVIGERDGLARVQEFLLTIR